MKRSAGAPCSIWRASVELDDDRADAVGGILDERGIQRVLEAGGGEDQQLLRLCAIGRSQADPAANHRRHAAAKAANPAPGHQLPPSRFVVYFKIQRLRSTVKPPPGTVAGATHARRFSAWGGIFSVDSR
jgi:hypothetical protein